MIYIVASIGSPDGESYRWLTTAPDIRFKRGQVMRDHHLEIPEDDIDTILHEYYTRKYQWSGVAVHAFEPDSIDTQEYSDLEYLLVCREQTKNRNLLERLIKVAMKIPVPESELHKEAF